MVENKSRKISKCCKISQKISLVPSEREFSVAGLTVKTKRSQLDPDTVDQIVFMDKVLHQMLAHEKSITDQTAKQEVRLITVKQEPEN